LSRRVLPVVLLALILVGGNVFADSDFIEFQRILNTKCSQCHPRARIEKAMQQGENFELILNKMLRFGAKLTSREQDVLGIFWSGGLSGTPEPSPPVEPIFKDPLGEYRAVIESRCTGCHSLERVEKAMLEGRSLDELIEMMRQRGAIISQSEQKVLGTFWGQPFKAKLPK